MGDGRSEAESQRDEGGLYCPFLYVRAAMAFAVALSSPPSFCQHIRYGLIDGGSNKEKGDSR